MASGHFSPLEHISFTFAITGVSRSLLAQLTRHRIASFSVQSQRYVNAKNPDYVVPDEIKSNPHALRIMEDFMNQASRAYSDIHTYLLSAELKEKYAGFVKHNGLNLVFENDPKYFHFALQSQMDNMIKDDPSPENTALYRQYRIDRFAAEKRANENARAVLPNAVCTNLVMTMNARELLHFFKLRCCNRAQKEIRDLSDKMLVLCKQVAPTIFQNAGAPCTHGSCPEGKLSCGNPRVATEKNSKGGKENG